MSFRKIHKLRPDIQKQLEKERLDLIESLTGADGKDGKDGLGARGARGQQGERGEAGMNGVNGMDGRDGRDGVDGKDGADGKDGEDGRGIKRIYIKNKNLHVEYTDGEERNLGLVVGRNGLPGKAGGVFGDTTINETNITEEVLDTEDKANLATTATKLTELVTAQHEQLLRVERELRYIKTHLGIVTNEKLDESDIGRDEQ